MSDNETQINIVSGSDVTIDGSQNGPIRVMVVDSHTGDAGYRQVSRGSTVGDVVESCGEVRRNGQPVATTDALEDGDKVSVTPENPEGN